jgi:methionyl-tRNA formyltransferase
VVAAYGKLIPETLLQVPPLGIINVHASLLPRYRGAAPVHRAVLAGEAETGVTIMRVIRELDAGGMFAKVMRPIGPDDTSDVVERDLAEIGAGLLVSVVEQLMLGTAREELQNSADATYAPRLTREAGLINWSQSAAAVHNQVRGLYPWPHAYTYLHDARLIVLRTRTTESMTQMVGGTVIDAGVDGIRVAGGDGAIIVLTEVQPEGRRAMSAREFLAGHPLPLGAVLGRQ